MKAIHVCMIHVSKSYKECLFFSQLLFNLFLFILDLLNIHLYIHAYMKPFLCYTKSSSQKTNVLPKSIDIIIIVTSNLEFIENSQVSPLHGLSSVL